MKKFTEIKSTAVHIETENVDTDQIIPARFLKNTGRDGFGQYLFHNWRHDENGIKKKHILNEEKSRRAKILVAGKNFGSGSSREHAVWALVDFGFHAVISSGFGDIFYNNALKNGLLLIKINESELKKLSGMLYLKTETEIQINLVKQTVEIPDEGIVINFEIDIFRKSCLILGTDELGYILSHEDKIAEYEKNI